MTVEDRRRRQLAVREALIVDAARMLAEREGWEAVTTRRLSGLIEYSQPVIYSHFASMTDLTRAVALLGFIELSDALTEARRSASPGSTLADVAAAYTDFAATKPAMYEAMFTRPTGLEFGPDAPDPLHAAFDELRTAVAPYAGGRDVDTLTEVVWAGLHGLTDLDRHGRLRPDHVDARLDTLILALSTTSPRARSRRR